MAAQTAEHFRVGPVFLAGDAAHVIPPVGGYGMNTGIQDAHNLAWKLAGVAAGWAAPSLLDTYEAERQPVARFVAEQALLNMRQPGRPEQYATKGLALGLSYGSAAVVPDGTSPPEVANPVTDYIPTARPGSRAPHVWVERDGRRISTIELFNTSFTVFAGTTGTVWRDAALVAARDMGVPSRRTPSEPAAISLTLREAGLRRMEWVPTVQCWLDPTVMSAGDRRWVSQMRRWRWSARCKAFWGSIRARRARRKVSEAKPQNRYSSCRVESRRGYFVHYVLKSHTAGATFS